MTHLAVLCFFTVLYFRSLKANLNKAFGKQSRQSTTYAGPELALNGKFHEYNVNEFQCAHTYGSFNAWWAVDLGDVYTVTNIIVYGRTDCCFTSLQNFDVEVIMQPECACDKWTTFHRGRAINCHYQLTNTMFVNITCPENTIGRFVRIQTRGYGAIVLCEVEVYGELFPVITATVTNTFKACGYIGQSYNGTWVGQTVARSKLECVRSCLLTDKCCAAEFSTSTGICTLNSKADDLEETTHSLVEDASKITFLV